MDQNARQLCPICGAPRDAAGGFACAACGFRTAFVTHFASPAAAELWRAELKRRIKPLPQVQALLAGRLSFGLKHVSLLLDKEHYLADGVYGETERDESILQVSRGDRHTVTLLRDGTVTAGSANEFGQCDVSSLRSIRQVIAAARCTYALRSDGRVQVAGVTGAGTLPLETLKGETLPFLKGWTDVVRLAAGEGHLAGLTAGGGVILGGFPPAAQERLSAEAAELRHVKGVAAAGSCTAALLEDGTVRFLGDKTDPRGSVSEWRSVVCVAAESGYVIGLTSEGRILMAGKVNPLLDMGRSDAAGWENIAAVACDRSAIAAVTADGELRMAGNVPQRAALLTAWDRDIRPALLRFIREQ